jgi:hypothetical protein
MGLFRPVAGQLCFYYLDLPRPTRFGVFAHTIIRGIYLFITCMVVMDFFHSICHSIVTTTKQINIREDKKSITTMEVISK